MNTGFERNTSLALINYVYLSKLMFTDKMTENTKGTTNYHKLNKI